MSYQQELYVAELAVQRASLLTQQVFNEKAKGTLSKDDKSPVTKGDFGAQALIIQAILKNFPGDEIVAEEEASALREDKPLSNEIWDLVKDIKLTDDESDKVLGGPLQSEEAMLDIIDQGKSAGGPKGRIWALDPIDVSDSAPIPANSTSTKTCGDGTGMLFSAVLGKGASSRPLSGGKLQESKSISMRPVLDITKASFCEGVEAAHSAQDDNAAVARMLGIIGPSVRLDSQAKYCSIARGTGDIYLRLPVRKDYQEKIWDHAAGDLLVREAGGMVTDIHGKRLDFGKGRTLVMNTGVIASPNAIHNQVIDAVQRVLRIK
ncbi:3',5'-bisphosphate nucleotidase [Histoplasma capsulatum H143]|uniref:3'(2'),5'-bisphosphate nucleotidase n=1 Tax=Ajellomyces capsulatus (strain H143) TaxID=544712 RepID=C6HD29_AJECH|nr:3',5'-bisphosphate nucleotidase [Histoplasma capsulatum H143]